MSAKDPNENRTGYKETKVGWIPEEWNAVRLNRAVHPIESGTSTKGGDGPPSVDQVGVLKVSAVTSGAFLPHESKTVAGEDMKRLRCPVTSDSILVNRANGSHALVGSAVKVKTAHSNLFLPDKLWKLTAKEELANVDFLLPILNSARFRQKVIDLSSGGTGMMNISSKAYLSIFIPFPSLAEQQEIADILSTCDEAIEKTGDLIKAKQRQKKALMQQLLTGKKRLPGFEGEWQEAALSTLLKESRETGNLGGVAKKLTVKLYGRGVVEKRETQAGSDATQYYRRRAGQFIYSKLDFLNGAFGIVPPELDGFESTLDLPAFDVSDSVIVDWLLYYVLQENFYKRWFPLANGGRKARRINPADFKHITVRVPPLGEQQAITDLLHDCEAQLGTLEAKLSALKKQKKALMQKLLTGQVRVKV